MAEERIGVSRATRMLLPSFLLAFLLHAFYRNYVLDDVFISLTYARSLAEGAGFRYNGVAVNAASSPLWVFVLSFALRLGLEGWVAAKVLGFCFSLGTLGLTYRLARGFGAGPRGGSLAACLVAAQPWLTKFSASGMETAMAGFWISMALWLIQDSRERTRQRRKVDPSDPVPPQIEADLIRPVLFGFLLGVAVLTRLEALLLVVLAFLQEALGFRTASSKRLAGFRWALALGVLALTLVPWHLYAYLDFGSVLPTTLGAKTDGPARAGALWASMKRVGVLSVVIFAVPGLLTLLGWARRRTRPSFEIAWALPLGAALVFALSGGEVSGRYLAPLVPGWIAWAVGFGLGRTRARIEEADSSIFDPGAKPELAVAPKISRGWYLLVLWGLGWAGVLNIPWVERYQHLLWNVEVHLGRRLAELEPKSGAVAAYDVGAIAYYSRRKIVDLVGLVTPEAQRATRARRVEVLAQTKPRFYVRPEPSGLPKPSELKAHATLLESLPVPGFQWRNPQPFEVQLFRLDWEPVPPKDP